MEVRKEGITGISSQSVMKVMYLVHLYDLCLFVLYVV